MPRKNSITDFVERQEILNNIQTSIKKLYADDILCKDEQYLTELAEKTLDVINYMDGVFDELIKEPGIEKVAEQFNTTKELIANDVIEIMLFSTIARQNMIINDLIGEEEE